MKINLILLSAIIMLFSACDSPSKESEFDKKAILQNLSENLIIPSYKKVLAEVSTLNEQARIFEENATEENLLKMREQWNVLAKAWKHAEVFNFGPIESNFIENSIDYWPLDTAGFEAAISAYDHQEEYFGTLGSNKKGIVAIEYLLFSQDVEQSLFNLQKRNKILFLQLLSENLIDQLSNVLEHWNNGYQQEFIENEGSTATSSITLVANEMIFLLEKIKNQKLALPMGKAAGKDANPQLVEAPYSDYSLALLKENLKSIQEVFNGGDGKGIDDYLNALNIKNDNNMLLSQQINEQFDQAILSCEKIGDSFSQAITSQNADLDQLYLHVMNLNILVKNDMMSQLGLLVTFSDNDGD